MKEIKAYVRPERVEAVVAAFHCGVGTPEHHPRVQER
jgi:hypothetical protein